MRIYRALLCLYPADLRAWFDLEMINAFESAMEERGRQRHFVIKEFAGLVSGAASAWLAKTTSSRYMRGFWAPTKMRGAGQTREQWFPAGARVLADVIEAQRRQS